MDFIKYFFNLLLNFGDERVITNIRNNHKIQDVFPDVEYACDYHEVSQHLAPRLHRLQIRSSGMIMMRIILLLFMFVLSGCREKVYDSFPTFEKVPVLNGFITCDSIVAVHISMATKLEKGFINGAEDAMVHFYEDSGSQIILKNEKEGWYRAQSRLESGHTYHCKVQIPGFTTINASAQIPAKPVLLNLEHIAIAGKDSEGTIYPAIDFTFENIPYEITYYEAVIRLIGRENSAELISISDPVLLEEGLQIALFSNLSILENTYTMRLNYTTGSASSTGIAGEWRTNLYPFVFELRKVSKDYYLHRRSLSIYETGRYPNFTLSGIPIFNVYSNIENGYGIFASYSSILSDTIYPSY